MQEDTPQDLSHVFEMLKQRFHSWVDATLQSAPPADAPRPQLINNRLYVDRNDISQETFDYIIAENFRANAAQKIAPFAECYIDASKFASNDEIFETAARAVKAMNQLQMHLDPVIIGYPDEQEKGLEYYAPLVERAAVEHGIRSTGKNFNVYVDNLDRKFAYWAEQARGLPKPKIPLPP